MNSSYHRVCAAVMIVLLAAAGTNTMFAQRYVDVQAGYGTLSNAISADSANRVANPNTIYLLHRGTKDSVYYLTRTLTNWGSMPLQIQATGTGQLPTLTATTLSDGTNMSPMISAKANLSMKGVFINGVNTIGVTVDRVIRIQSNGVTVKLDSCQVNFSTQSFIRVDNTNARIFLVNCRVSNCYSDWANARGIDNRGITIDTLSMVGCTFYRIGQRAYRDGGGILTYGYFNHNTFIETGSAILSLGSAKNVVLMNNLGYNCGFLGSGKSSVNDRLIGLTPLSSGQSVIATNNNFFADTVALRAAYRVLTDTIGFTPVYADTILVFMNAAGTASKNISSPVTFTMPPGNVTNVIKVDSIARWYWRNPTAGAADASMLKVENVGAVNLAYNTTASSYTFGTDGKPLGAPEWFGIMVGIEKTSGGYVPSTFTLSQNYPNPFNPATTISYQLPVQSSVSLRVYDVLGREVAILFNGVQTAGAYTTTFDASRFSSGVYLYQLKTENFIQTRKMLLMK